MKKILALALCLLMVVSMVACGAKEPTVAEGELPTITLWSSGSQNVADTFNELINMYNAKPDRRPTLLCSSFCPAPATPACLPVTAQPGRLASTTTST